MTCNDDCNDALWTEADRWTWQISVPYDDAGVFIATCNSTCDEPLRTWGKRPFVAVYRLCMAIPRFLVLERHKTLQVEFWLEAE